MNIALDSKNLIFSKSFSISADYSSYNADTVLSRDIVTGFSNAKYANVIISGFITPPNSPMNAYQYSIKYFPIINSFLIFPNIQFDINHTLCYDALVEQNSPNSPNNPYDFINPKISFLLESSKLILKSTYFSVYEGSTSSIYIHAGVIGHIMVYSD